MEIGYEIAYIVAKQTDVPRSSENDLEANAVWQLVGETHASSIPLAGTSELNDLIAEAKVGAYLNQTGNISITGPSNPVVENSDKYGPFKIIYPTYTASSGEQKLVGDSITIKVNGKTLSYIPESGKEFYLTEVDGIKYGEENEIQVEYKGSIWKANGWYAKFTPKRTLTVYAYCDECGAQFIYTAEGWIHAGKVLDVEPTSTWVPSASNKHNDDECTGSIRASYNNMVAKGDDLQNLIYIYSDQNKINETKSLKFWAGKPDIEINLNKVNPKNQAISGVEFKVDVENGTINSSISATVSGNSSFKIKPNKGKDTVTVTLTETVVPEDYAKFTSPITITYKWNGTSWEKSSLELPTGVTEGKSVTIEATGKNRQTSNCSDIFKITIVNRPVIRITLDKKDPQGNTVNVDFDITVTGGTPKQNTIKDGETVIIEPEEGQDNVKVTLTENDPGEEFVQYEESIEMNFSFDGEKWALGLYSKPEAPEKVEVKENGENKVLIKAINRRKIIIDLKKTDNAGRQLAGMTFDINVINGECENTTITTDNSGAAQILIIPDGTDDVTLALTEHNDIYYINPGTITIKFTYQGGSWKPNITTSTTGRVGNISISGTIARFDLTIENIAKIEDVTLEKINKYFPDEKIEGVTFRIVLQNARTIAGATTITRQTDEDGQIKLGTLEVLNPAQDIRIILTETGTPTTTGLNYRGLEGATIEIVFRHKESGCNVTVSGGDRTLADAIYNLRTNMVDIQLQNEVTIDLTGKVWEDGQTGLKPVKSPNGMQDSTENGLANIKVELIRTNDSKIPEVGGIDRLTTKTDNDGNYEFKDIPASINDKILYYIEFTYDGINYITVARDVGTDDTIDSDVSEINRTEFNNKFQTIVKDNAISTSGEQTSLEYDYDATTAKLITTEADGTVKEKFVMKATTLPETYSRNTNNIDMGLVKKGVDLAAVTDIEQAKVSINGKEQIYKYNDIQKLAKDANGNPIIDTLKTENVQYNLYLYNSDYNYRIGNYKLPAVHSDILTVNTNGVTTYLDDQREADGELDIEVTYQILLNNQSATNSIINQIAYYYDVNYELQMANVRPELVTLNGKTYNKVVLNVNKVFTSTNNQGVAELIFKVKKDASGYVYTGLMKTYVEIISYSTNESCIDIDSAPDNIEVHPKEDDTDDAAGLNIKLNNIDRKISGYVFEDSKTENLPGTYNTGNGTYEDSEKLIDDVIVQLIEIKNVKVGNTTLKLEYIWQETTSGSNKVIYVTEDGKEKGEYSVTNDKGEYKFIEHIIPGDYIVRFIYGDGTYWDSAINTDNLLKYNGQDYKSTTDMYYNKLNYSTSYPANSSMARDNEARRLEEISFATSLAPAEAYKLKIDSKEKLVDTWMCAETSNLEMKVSDAIVEGDSTNSIKRGINFGLVERPRENLVLEKHLTYLKIDGITEGKTSFDNYNSTDVKNNGGSVSLDSKIGDGIFATATNKNENTRGEWLVQTESSQINGKRMDLTYSYRVTNIGDIDYIGEKLRNTLTDPNNTLTDSETYKSIAQDVKAKMSNLDSIYTIGEYLGTAYYSGTIGISDIRTSVPFQVEDYMSKSNGLLLDSSSSSFKATGTGDKMTYQYSPGNSTIKTVVEGTENVDIIQTDRYVVDDSTGQLNLTLKLYDEHLDSASSRKEFIYRSYAAQLIYPTSGRITSESGSLCSNEITLSNLKYVQSYVNNLDAVSIIEIVPEADEFIAESVNITLDTGEDKKSPTMLIISITAGLGVVAVGIVLIKKFIIK